MSISPDGKLLGYLVTRGEEEMLAVYDIATKERFGIDTSSVKSRWVDFAEGGYVLLGASETVSAWYAKSDFEFTGSFSFNLETKRMRKLLEDERTLYPTQSGVGRIVGRDKTGPYVYMPAYGHTGSYPPPSYLYKVNLNNGNRRIFARGRAATVGWFVNGEGVVLGREDIDR